MKKVLLAIAILGAVTNVNSQALVLKSTVSVPYVVKGSINEIKSTKVRGVVGGSYWNKDCTSLSVDYSYTTSDSINIKTDAYKAGEAEINAVYEIIKDSIPSGVISRTKAQEWEIALGFRVIMAQTFSLSVGDIQIVNE